MEMSASMVLELSIHSTEMRHNLNWVGAKDRQVRHRKRGKRREKERERYRNCIIKVK